MKLRLLLASLCLGALFTGVAQECELPLTIVPSQEGDVVPPAVTSRLNSKLQTLMTRVGVVGAENSQFFVTGRFDTGFSEQTSGPTPAEYVHTTLTLFIGDAESQKMFSSLTLELKGVGSSVEQAYTKAINSINFNRNDFQNFIQQGKQKIISYYDANYSSILAQASSAANLRNYDEALYYVTQIPECCVGYSEAQALMNKVYASQQNYDGQMLLSQAKAEWAADPTEEGARKAFSYINQIDPASSAYSDAQKLGTQIQKTVKANWDFENVQKYKDEVALRKQAINAATSLEKERIKAARAVATAYAKSRRTVVYKYYGWY
jgi:hypothetical protein